MGAERGVRQPDEIIVRTPCCGRKVGSVRLYRAAADMRHRTCPKCKARWDVGTKPNQFIENPDTHHLRRGFTLTWHRTNPPLEERDG